LVPGMKNQPFKSKTEYLLIAALFVLLICLFFYPVVLGERTLFPIFPGVLLDGPYGYQGEKPQNVSDPTAFLWTEIPGTIFASRAIKSGQIPLWNPYVGGGTSLSANLMVGVYNPFKAFLLVLSTPGMFNFYLLLRLFLAGFFTYLFLRKIKLSKSSAMVGALFFMFSGHYVCYLTLWHLNTDFLIPLLLYFFELVMREKKKRHILFSMICVALVILAGSPQSAFLTLVFACLYYYVRLFSSDKIRLTLTAISIKSFCLLLIILGGVLLCAVMVADFYQFYSSGIHQANLVRYQDLIDARLNRYSIQSLISFIFSPFQLMGSAVSGDPPNVSRIAQIYSFPYLGVIPIILATMALGKNRRANRLGWFFIVFVSILIFNVLGGTALINRMLGGLITPFTSLFWAKYLGTLVFSVAVLSALGFENIKNKSVFPLRVGLVLSLIIVFVAGCYFFDPATYKRIFEISSVNQFSFKNLLFPGDFPLSFRALAIATIFLLSVSLVYRLNSAWLSFLLVCMLFGEMYIYHQPVYARRHDPYAKAPYIEYLMNRKSEAPPFRICGGAIPQISSVFGLEDINNIDAIYLERYYSFLMNLILETDMHYGVLSLTPTEPAEFKSRFMDLLNVKYLVSLKSLNPLPGISDIEGKEIAKSNYFGRDFLRLYPNSIKDKMSHLDSAYSGVTVPVDGARLHFNLGIAPDQWLRAGDGVEFVITAENDSEEKIIFRKYIDSKKRELDRKCFSENISLDSYKGQKVELTFSVHPGPEADNRFDQCGFSDIELVPSTVSDQKLTLVYDNEIRIYRNNTVMPRAFIVHRAESIRVKEEIFERLRDINFNFRERIIVEEALPEDMLKCKGAPLKDSSSVTIKSYTPNRIVLEATMQHDGFLVLADTYYPRWRAYVDGREKKIYPADYMLRAVYLSSGKHEVIFAYDVLPFKSLLDH